MRRSNFFLVYLLLVVAQILICNYFHLTPYVTLSLLPVMVLCLPVRVSTLGALFIAFATGMSVDFLAEGLPGLNTLALLPVGYFLFVSPGMEGSVLLRAPAPMISRSVMSVSSKKQLSPRMTYPSGSTRTTRCITYFPLARR